MSKEYAKRTITCVGCGKTITGRLRPAQKYCSLQCFRASPRPNRKNGKYVRCEWCDQRFYLPKARLEKAQHYFCSTDHQICWQGRNKVEYQCETCGTPFRWSPSREKSNNIRYCSLKCRDADPRRRQQLLTMNQSQQYCSPTSIEKIGYGILDNLDVDYVRQHTIGGKFCVDAFLPECGIVVQFDGDYWHGHPDRFPEPDRRQKKRMTLDRSQDAYMAACGYRVVRFWGTTLRNAPDTVRDKLRKTVSV